MALEARRRIEMHALLAAMQRGSAFGAVAPEVRIGRQRHGAAKAARSYDILYESGKLGPGNIERLFGPCGFGRSVG